MSLAGFVGSSAGTVLVEPQNGRQRGLCNSRSRCARHIRSSTASWMPHRHAAGPSTLMSLREGDSGRRPQMDGDGQPRGKEEFLELDDYRTGDRFRDFESDWQEVTMDNDDNDLVFEDVEVDEFGIDKDGRDLVEQGMPLRSDTPRRRRSRRNDGGFDSGSRNTKNRFSSSNNSNRNGNRDDSPRGSNAKSERLFQALRKLKVAASETCEYLIDIGVVTVNGQVVTDRLHRVNITVDKIAVNGKSVILVDESQAGKDTFSKKNRKQKTSKGGEKLDEKDLDILPRSQRDFRESGIAKKALEEGVDFQGKKVDGGFLASKKKRSPRRK